MKILDEQDFQLLQVLDRTHNITHAADELYITQSSVSKRIRQLERDLGMTLLLRSRQGIQFTPAGEIVLHHIRAIQRELNAIRQELADASGTIAGTLRAGVSINYAMYRLPAQLVEYKQRYPHVSTRIVTAQSQAVYSMLLANKIDVGILRGEHAEWRGERILLDREPVCAITCERDAGRPLASLPQIHRQTDIDMEREIAQWMRENHIPAAKDCIEVNSTATCVKMVVCGLGWGIVPRICLDGFQGSIRPLFFANRKPLIRSTYIMFMPWALELPQVRVFIEMIQSRARGETASV